MNEFAAYTNAEQMKAIFAQDLFASERNGLEISNCAILHTWYKPYRKNPANSFLTVLYELELKQRQTQQRTRHWLYAKAYLQNRSQLVFRQHVNSRLCPPTIGQAFSHLPAYDMVVWGFPNDPALPQLAELIHPEKAKQHLPYSQLPAGLAAGDDSTELTIEVINYRPELRCTARYELRYATGGRTVTQMLFGKTFATEQGADIFARMQTLAASARLNPDAFHIAPPLAFHAATNTIWQEGLAGTPLAQVLTPENHHSITAQLTKGLINLHKTKIPVSNRLTLDTHLAEAEKKAKKLEQAFPAFRATLAELLQRLKTNKPGEVAAQVIHGDFHLNQLLWSDGRIALFDYDEFALGDPLQDVANFLADLHARPVDPMFIEAITTALLAAYQQQAASQFSFARFDWHWRVQMLTRAYRCLWQQKPDLERSIRFYLQLAQNGCPHLAHAA